MAERPLNFSSHADLQLRFDGAMERFAPFEDRPHLAVAVSGGPDSMALAVLARHWAGQRGGEVTALVVDHGLRPESSEEALRVHQQLCSLGITAAVLRWTGDKPATGIQAAARDARYRLLREWCGQHAVLHLLTGHHADDQHETIAMRAARRSGVEGLAGMSSVVEWTDCRLLRPLLGQRRSDMRAFLSVQGIPWIEDPSNRDDRFERARLRRTASFDVGWPDRARHAAHRRQVHERLVLGALARSASPHPFGYCTLDLEALQSDAPEIMSGALARVVGWVGGQHYLPGPESTAQLRTRILDLAPGRAATMGGCLLTLRRGTLAVTREPGRLPPVRPFAGPTGVWDGRFRVTLLAPAGNRAVGVGPLGRQGWARVAPEVSRDLVAGVPKAAIWALPALWIDGVVACVPQLSIKCPSIHQFSATFRPHRSLFSSTFAVA